MEVKEGYKQTEVGVIPEDWDVKSLADIGRFSKGSGIKRDDISDEGFGCIRYGEIYTRYDNYVLTLLSLIPPHIALSALPIRKGDLLFAGSGETAEEIGKCIAYLGEDEAYAGGDIVVLTPSEQDPWYLGYLMNYEAVTRQKAILSQGDAIVHISVSNLAKLKFPLPKVPEQRTIRLALSVADTLINSLEKLIVKKRNIKQGTMQQLLTGKKRLPGFGGEWETKRLGEIAGTITTGKLDANAMVENGEYRFYTCAKEYYHIDHYAFDTEALLVSGNGANVGYIHYYKGKFNAYQRTYVLTKFSENIFYIKFIMDNYLKSRITTEVNAGNTPYIKMDTLTAMKIIIPPTKAEQTAIAQVLSGMDADIEKLEQKLSKHRLIKQGMMQELLTGKKRLL